MMFYSLESAIQQLFGMEMQISERSRVFGGDANDTFRLTLKDGTGLFMKVNTVPMLSSFQAEAEGLEPATAARRLSVVRTVRFR